MREEGKWKKLRHRVGQSEGKLASRVSVTAQEMMPQLIGYTKLPIPAYPPPPPPSSATLLNMKII